MSGTRLFSSQEPVALNQVVLGGFLNNLLMNKPQQLFKKCFVSSRELEGTSVMPLSFSPCAGRVAVLFLEKKGSLGGIAGSLSTGLRGRWLRPGPQSPSTHNSFERYAKLAELLTSSLPRQAPLQVGFYIYVKQK